MSDKVRDRAIQLVRVKITVDFTKHILLSSAHEQDSTNERIVFVTHNFWSAVNRPIEVGIVPISWFALRYLSIAQSTNTDVISKKRDSANETIVIVTDNCVSAVNCPIEVGIVPLSRLAWTNLLISQSKHCCYHTNMNRETAQTREL